MTAPTIAELIEYLRGKGHPDHEKELAAANYLEKLQSIESQPVPVEPRIHWHPTIGSHGVIISEPYVSKADYDSLQSALKLAQEERDKRMTRMMAAEKRAEKAESERDKCKRIAWEWGQGVTDAETAIRQLHKLFPIDAELLKEIEK